MVLRPGAVRGVALATALACWGGAAASIASAENLEDAGFRLEIPAGYVRASSEVEQAALDRTQVRRTVKTAPATPPRVWVYVKAYEQGEARLTVMHEAGAMPTADDPEFLRGQRLTLESAAQAHRGTVNLLRNRTLPGGQLILEGQVTAALETSEALSVHLAMLPRKGFGLSLGLHSSSAAAKEADRTWEALLASLTSDAPPPDRRSRSPSDERRFMWLALLVVAAIAAGAVVRRRLRRTAPPGDGQRDDEARRDTPSGGESTGP